VVVAFTWSIALFYFPGQGFTHLIVFGSKEHQRFLPEIQVANHYEQPDSTGYDSEWYAQIAVRPHLADPALNASVDSLLYRARRILFEWTAWAIGGGDPQRILYVYAFQNIACWYLLAALLMRWLPPTSWDNVGRWAGMLFSFGFIFSVRRALPDGPSLLLLAAAMALLGSGRPWLGALLLGVTGLGKDTCILGGAAVELPSLRDRRSWTVWLGRMALVVLPIVLWIAYIRSLLGPGEDIGARNFSVPFVAMGHKLLDSAAWFISDGFPFRSVAKLDLIVMIGLLIQFGFFAFRIRWRDPWWRLGASFAVLMACLGEAVWEGYPSAAARVLLPMTLAFNVSVPKGRWWALLVFAGNLGFLGSIDLLKPPGRESYNVEGPSELRTELTTGRLVEVHYSGSNWFFPERSRLEYWLWAMGEGAVTIVNPHPFAMVADVGFGLSSVDLRDGIVSIGGRLVWKGPIQPGQTWPVVLRDVLLPPGETAILFRSNLPARYPGNGDHRKLMYSVRNLEVDLKERR
jgi:hypothetical protein